MLSVALVMGSLCFASVSGMLVIHCVYVFAVGRLHASILKTADTLIRLLYCNFRLSSCAHLELHFCKRSCHPDNSVIHITPTAAAVVDLTDAT